MVKALPRQQGGLGSCVLGRCIIGAICLVLPILSSAKLAAKRRLSYVLALFLNNDEAVMSEAVETYRRLYPTGAVSPPQLMLALPVIVAETDGEAAQYAAEVKVVRIHLKSGKSFTLRSEEAAREFGRQAQEQHTIEVRPGNVIYGSRETVYRKLGDVQRRYLVDELIIVTAIRDFAKRLHSYELLSEAFNRIALNRV